MAATCEPTSPLLAPRPSLAVCLYSYILKPRLFCGVPNRMVRILHIPYLGCM